MLLTPSLLVDVGLIAIVLVMGWHASYCWRRRRFFLLDPLNAFWGGVVICYVVQPITEYDSLLSWRGAALIEKTVFLVLLAVVGLVMGYESRLGLKLGRYIPPMPSTLRADRFVGAALAMIGLGLVGYAYQASSAGSWSAWVSVGRTATNWEAVSAYVAQLDAFLPLGVGLLLFHVEFHPERAARRVLAWAAGALQWWWFIYIGTRSRTVAFALLMLAAYYLPKRRNPHPLAVPVLFGFLAVLVNFEAAYRDRFTNLSIWGNLDYEEVISGAPDWIVGGSRRGEPSSGLEFNCVAAVVELVPEVVDYNYGYSHLELFTRVIPRAVWPDKIYPHYRAYTPIYRAGGLSSIPIPTAKEYLLMGPAFTFVGHWYSVGGVIAVAAAAFLTGAVFRAVRGIYDRKQGAEGDTILYASLVPLGFGEAAGEPLFFLFSVPFTLLPLVLVLVWSGRGQTATARAIGGS
jgi:hypothetical protein